MGHYKTKLGSQQSFIEKKYRVLKSNPGQSNSHPGEQEPCIFNIFAAIIPVGQSCEFIHQIMYTGVGRIIWSGISKLQSL